MDYTLQPSPVRRLTSNVFGTGVEGAWIPTLTFVTPGDLAILYTTRAGRYVRILNEVRASFYIAIVAFDFTHTTASGSLKITGLPFPAGSPIDSSAEFSQGSLSFTGITKANYTQFVPSVTEGESFIFIEASGSGQGLSTVTAADMPTNTVKFLFGSLTYSLSNDI